MPETRATAQAARNESVRALVVALVEDVIRLGGRGIWKEEEGE